ncbi:MAG TPA: glycosyltransferase family 4 protein [Candidatus Moranbacteria bacterium]|nr:glycosyltransferase family 4 protein [Candidatus Moranbacteria bacterium]
MKIAIDASRAFVEERTGIEEYSYQVIKNLRGKLGEENQVLLYGYRGARKRIDFKLPKNWEFKEVAWNKLWTQIGLSWVIKNDAPDVLFVPAHNLPWLHPKNSVVTIHGLEYEHFPESYGLISVLFHRFFIKKSCRWARVLIAVSENTKKDLEKLYKVKSEKITVIANGFEISNQKTEENVKEKIKNISKEPFCLFLGRIELRKNVDNIARAFDLLKSRYNYPGKLILAGRPGYGYEKIKKSINDLSGANSIEELGYLSIAEKELLLSKADLFFFPSLAEGFGIPILEAQSVGTPVITSSFGPMDEVAGDKNILVNPKDSTVMAKLASKMISDNKFREKVIANGLKNAKRFSWDKCAREVAEVILGVVN